MDEISDVGRACICVGTGNEGVSAGHVSGILTEAQEEQIEFAVQDRQTAFSIQIWKRYEDKVRIEIQTPSGVTGGPIDEVLGTQRLRVNGAEILLYYGEPSP